MLTYQPLKLYNESTQKSTGGGYGSRSGYAVIGQAHAVVGGKLCPRGRDFGGYRQLFFGVCRQYAGAHPVGARNNRNVRHGLSRVLDINQTTVSHQLRFLKNIGIVKCSRFGKVIFYSLKNDTVNDVLLKGVEFLGYWAKKERRASCSFLLQIAPRYCIIEEANLSIQYSI